MIPLFWIAAALAVGIALGGLWPQAPLAWLVLALSSVVVGLLFVRRRRLRSAAAAALLAWALVGVAAISLQHASQSADRADRLVAAGSVDLSVPLRWRGRLVDDPLHLPWGYRYVIALRQVEVAGKYIPASGGLRLNLYDDDLEDYGPPAVRAGDTVEALAQARLPRNFLDPGAFDYRGYLARQGIELEGTLRSPVLLRRLPGPSPTLRARVARLRGSLRHEADQVFGPAEAPVIRAMLLGDRSFIDTSLA